MDVYQKKIVEAGLWDGALDGEKILIAKELLASGMLIFCLLFRVPWVLSLWFIIGGFFLPDIYLRDKKNRRKIEIIRSLPDFLDMLTLIVEAGLDFGNALQIILQKGKKNALTQELELAVKEIRLGTPRATALQNMAERLKIRDINLFVSAVVQSDQMGTGLGGALRIQADTNRERRMQRAEKLALEAPVKMIFPLVFFIFPVVFIVLLGPVIVQWLQR
jgi:tight adherence protein C